MPRNAPKTLPEATEDFRRVRKAGYSTNTWVGINRVLTRWEQWMYDETQPNVYLEDIDDRHMVRWFDKIRPPAYETSTFNNYRQYMCLFWAHCRDEGWVNTNPMRHVRPMRVAKKVRLQLSKEEMLQMLDLAAHPRDRAGLALGMNTALRAGDAMALTVGSLDFYSDHLTAWIEKTDKWLELPMTSDLRDEMLRWLEFYASEHGLTLQELPNDWTLIPPMRGVAVNVWDTSLGTKIQYKVKERYRHPEQIVHRGLTTIGLPTYKEGFHTLRRSMLRAIYDDALDDGDADPIRFAQAMADHASRTTTELYLGVTVEKRLLDERMRGKSFLTREISVGHDAPTAVPIVGELSA